MIDKRKLEAVLDWVAIAGILVLLPFTIAGIFPHAATDWSVGLFTGWLLRLMLR